MERFEIVVACGVARRLVAVYEIIVERDHLGLEQIRGQIYAQTFRCCGLAARRRPGNQHDPRSSEAVSSRDFIGYRRDFLVVHRFGHVDQVGGFPFFHHAVELAYVGHTYHLIEVAVFHEGAVHFFLVDFGGRAVGMVAVERHQEESLLVGDEIEHREASGGGGQCTVVAVDHSVETIVGGVKLADGL